ncbi:MAG: hypothetical protein M3487_07055 [Actinomycetota bacterium]|nr:hypothetical protein [Acidimicrobiia bacterium]MDQ3469508.1 hypothetical protein [Actinomycetota bacterium]
MDAPQAEAERSRTVVVRVWLPDRPGALGQVASRIGALHGDVTAIDILERGGGRVIDELVVSLPESASEDLLAREMRAVDGVAVEHIRPVGAERPDSATAVLALAARVADAPAERRLHVLCTGLLVALDVDWIVAVRDGSILRQVGTPPEREWLLAFLDGLRGSGHLDPCPPGSATPTDVVWMALRGADLTVAAGRAARPIHERERERVVLLARVADALLASP